MSCVCSDVLKNIIILTVFVMTPMIFAQETEVDHLALASLLIKDGNYGRAQRTLTKVTKEEREKNEVLLETLWGMVFLQQQKYEKALEKINKALSLGSQEKELFLYRAEALVQMGDQIDLALNDLEKIALEDKKKLPYFLIKAEGLWKQGYKIKAWRTLDQALQHGLSLAVITKKKFFYLLEEGLFISAQEMAFSLFSVPESFNDILAMASQLRIKKEYQKSLELLQVLQFLRPEKEMVALEMAQNYLALEQSFSAALILEKAAKHNVSLSFEASEMLRQVGKSYRARFLNMSTLDPTKRLKQKLSLFLEDDDYHSLKFLIPQLRKNQMLEDQEIRYAVAYSLFKTGDFRSSEDYLNSIDKDGLFEKSIELKQEILNCEKQRWACNETI